MHSYQKHQSKSAFTLIELLVVLGIIGLLAAILFPALRAAREKSYQASCASSLHQIYLAVELYRKDEGNYPASFAALLDNTDDIADYAGNTSVADSGGKGYFKGGKDALVCADDDTDSSLPRSSYGDLSVNINDGTQRDMGRFVWNYWGYRAKDDTGTCDDNNVSGCMGTAYNASELESYGDTFLAVNYESIFANQSKYLVDPSNAYNNSSNPVDVTKLPRLANRFAPSSTIITHCVYHRLATSNVKEPFDIYNPDGSGQGAKDIILLLDGSTKVLDVTTSAFVDDNLWATQRF